MSLTRKHLMILAACMGLLALTACTREITTIVQEEPQPSSCFECHDDQNTFLVGIELQWTKSRHASGEAVHEGTNASCVRCHASEGFIQYINGETPAATQTPTVIHCFTCHAPHTNSDFNLRVDTAQTLLNGVSHDIGAGNTCVVCHQSRRDVATYITASNNLSRYFGPHHGPQSDMLFGTNGYEYEGYVYEETPYHRTLTQDGCVDCHVRYVGEGYMVGGHSFAMTAELSEESGGGTVYNTQACAVCHEDIGDDYDYAGVQADIDSKLAELQALLQAEGLVDANGTSLSVQGVSADLAGAVWNFKMVGSEDRSHGVHNPDYAVGLLESSISYLNSLTPAR